MDGQLSLYDIEEKRRPCQYSFQRYIGQEIIVQDGVIGKIVKIEPYYTLVAAEGKIWAMTPTTIRRKDFNTDKRDYCNLRKDKI